VREPPLDRLNRLQSEVAELEADLAPLLNADGQSPDSSIARAVQPAAVAKGLEALAARLRGIAGAVGEAGSGTAARDAAGDVAGRLVARVEGAAAGGAAGGKGSVSLMIFFFFFFLLQLFFFFFKKKKMSRLENSTFSPTRSPVYLRLPPLNYYLYCFF
jgi:hypothetical protein